MTQPIASSSRSSSVSVSAVYEIPLEDEDQEGGDIGVDTSFSQISLSSERTSPTKANGNGKSSPSPSPSPPSVERIEYFPTQSHSQSPSRVTPPIKRTLTRSPSYSQSPLPSPSLSPSPSPRNRSHNLEISPSKIPLPLTSPTSLSPPYSAPPSRLSFRHSLSTSPPPQPKFLPFQPPTSTSTNNDDIVAEDGDLSAPFESIPLHSTTPPPPDLAALATVPLPSSPRTLSPPGSNGKKRQSWGGFGMTKDGVRYANGETPTHSRAQTGRHTPTSAADDSHEQEEANGTQTQDGDPTSGPSTPSRIHAPPAHPFPFPMPGSTTSPPVIDNKRLSIISTTSATSSQPSTGISSQSHPGGLGVKGISTFEKVISHTRPSWLPPKDHAEDEVHLHQWEEMMKKSREHEKELKRLAEIRRVEREKRMAMNMPKWDILLGSGEFSVAKVKNDKVLRKMWFEGIPSHLRGKAWAMAIGNPLALSKDAYKLCTNRARKALSSGRFPKDILDRMETDLDQTLVTLRLFGQGSPLRADLHELLCAWVVYRSDDGLGYAPYITLLGAMFLLVSPPSQAFSSLINLLSRPCLRAFFTETTDEIDAYYRVFENLQADTFPKIYANCKNLGLKVPESWFRSVLVEQVPFEAACRLWDQIVLDGDGYIFRAALAIFGFLEPRLYYPDREEILSVLEGRNRATLAITKRERERAKLRGEAFDEALDGKLSVFGLHEDALFDWLENDEWKESRFDRLVLREMPD